MFSVLTQAGRSVRIKKRTISNRLLMVREDHYCFFTIAPGQAGAAALGGCEPDQTGFFSGTP
jgi:hypothetical protein